MKKTYKFSIVTPTYNSENFIGETIESVISQVGDFSIEYLIMDGGSTDATREIVQRFQNLISDNIYPIQCNDVVIYWHSEKDDGMYAAINNGFNNSTGDICAYINSDDIYLPGALNTIAAVFAKYPNIDWLKGISSFMNSNSTICSVDQCHLYVQKWIAKGVYGRLLQFINQEGVFWRKCLWEKGGGFELSIKLAGDYYLWTMFARFAPLVTVKAYVSSFRVVEGQISSNISEYRKEMDKVCPPDNRLKMIITSEKLIRRISNVGRNIPAWMRPYFLFFLKLVDKQQYCAVEISTNTDIQLYEGDYYSVSTRLQWSSTEPTPE